jgi:hypothetical protein
LLAALIAAIFSRIRNARELSRKQQRSRHAGTFAIN